MEAVDYAARGNLRRLLVEHADWTREHYAQATGMSVGWVDKWKKRLGNAPPTDEQVLHGLSRAPKHPPPRLDAKVVDRVLSIRDEPPEELGRTPGPKAILYYLPRDQSLQQTGLCLPRSTRTIHRLRRVHSRIALRVPHPPEPTERPKPMAEWQLDAHSMPPAFQRTQTANNNMSSKRSTSSTRAPQCSSPAMSAPILPQKRR